MNNEQLTQLFQFGGVLGVVAAGGFYSLRWVLATIKRLPQLTTTTTTENTTIVTADTVAMERLVKALETFSSSVEESNIVLVDIRDMIQKDIADRTFDERVEAEIEKREAKAKAMRSRKVAEGN